MWKQIFIKGSGQGLTSTMGGWGEMQDVDSPFILMHCTILFCLQDAAPLQASSLAELFKKKGDIQGEEVFIFICRVCIHSNQLPVKGQLYQ